MKRLKKCDEYAIRIKDAIENLFRDEENQVPVQIDLKELDDGENCTEFFIGYLTAGTLIFNEFVGEDKNNLEFTYLLNQLCVQNLLRIDLIE